MKSLRAAEAARTLAPRLFLLDETGTLQVHARETGVAGTGVARNFGRDRRGRVLAKQRAVLHALVVEVARALERRGALLGLAFPAVGLVTHYALVHILRSIFRYNQCQKIAYFRSRQIERKIYLWCILGT